MDSPHCITLTRATHLMKPLKPIKILKKNFKLAIPADVQFQQSHSENERIHLALETLRLQHGSCNSEENIQHEYIH